MRDIGVGLLGFGTVGAGFVEGLTRNADVLAERLGARLVLRAIADLDLESDRGVDVDRKLLTKDAQGVIDDPEVDVVVELIGGIGVARDLTLSALRTGKPLVTANKALLANHGEEIFRLADEKKVDIYFGASVGGGIPIIRALREGLAGNRIQSMYGILNGTCNSILTKMDRDGLPFDVALAQAQEAGYAEADPSLDIDGIDTAHKAVILASLAYGFYPSMDQVHVEGIRDLDQIDIRYAGDFGYRVKLLAVVKRHGDTVELRVHPSLVAEDHVLASVNGVYNAVFVEGDLSGQTLYYGRGAGREPTASTVIGDVVDVARNLLAGSPRRLPAVAESINKCRVCDVCEIRSRYYFRLALVDEPGVFAQISKVLGDNGISIASVLQKEGGEGQYVPVVIVTHEAVERQVADALETIDKLKEVGAPTVRLRIEG